MYTSYMASHDRAGVMGKMGCMEYASQHIARLCIPNCVPIVCENDIPTNVDWV